MPNNNARSENIAPVDYPKLLDERCRGKKELAAKLLRNLVYDSGPRWIKEAEDALSIEDMACLARVGHSIKGSCNMIYAGEMVRTALNLENAGKEGSRELASIALNDLKLAFSQTRKWLQQNFQFIE